jgi:dipeptidyl aminopeptidase/acylaminoacyl peptidase
MHVFRLPVTLPLFALVLVSGLSVAGQSSAGRALRIEDYYRIRNVGSPTVSPNGQWVAFAVTTRVDDDKDANKSASEGWYVPIDGRVPPARVEPNGGDVTNLRWLDDNRLQYSRDQQQWTIDPSKPSESAVRVESAERGGRGGRGGGRGRGAATATPSPDGRWRAELRDKPQTKNEPQYASDFEKRHQQRFEGAIFDWKDFQRDGQPFPVPDPRARPAVQIVVTPTGPGEPKTLVDADLRPSAIAWHPDGQRLAFVADPDWRDELKYESPDLWTVTIDGSVSPLTNDGYVYSDPEFSPDGKYLSYTRTFGTDMIIQQKLNHGGPRDLFIRPVTDGLRRGGAERAESGEPVNLTAKWDLEPGSAQWSPDSRFIYFTAAIGGENHLFRTSVPAGVVEQVTKGPRRLNGLSIDKSFTKIVYTVGVHDAPADVYSANIDGSDERRLTQMHTAITSEIAFSRAERLTWGSKDGTKIEGWLMYPFGYDAAKGPYPMIVTSHGGPHAATGYSFDFKDQYFAANGYFVFDTNFRSSTGYGDAFKWATWGAWGDKDGQDVVSGIDYVLKRYPIDPKRVGHTGHSYGGFMTNWLITQYPDRFAAAITGAGITNWVSDYGTADIYRTKETEFFGSPWDAKAREIMIRQSPLSYAGRVKTPTLFIHGESDQRVPYEEGEQMYFALRRRGIPAKMIMYKGQPHGISGNWNNVHRMLNELAWWEQYLKRPASSTAGTGR